MRMKTKMKWQFAAGTAVATNAGYEMWGPK